MRFRDAGLAGFALSTFLLAGAALSAQQLPPAEPPQPMPVPGVPSGSPTLRLTAREVLVPTLVEKPGGDVVYG
ncbi:MAG: hypothetical protein WCE75_08685, partial [Terracidiphilus sp.]